MTQSWYSHAKWIWLGQKGTLNQYVDFCRTFFLEDPAQTLELHISADSRYVCFLNGHFLPISQYADYPEHKIYDTISLQPYLIKGENTLLITGYFQGEDSQMYRLGEAGLIYAITVGGSTVLCSDEGTLCRQSPIYQSGEIERISCQLSFSFRYNATQEAPLDLTDSSWQHATVLARKTALSPRPIAQLEFRSRVPSKIAAHGVMTDCQPIPTFAGERMQRAFLSSRRTKAVGQSLPADISFDAESADGIYVLADLGNEEAGLLDIELTLPEAATVLIGFGEHLEDLRIRADIDGRQFSAVYIAKSGHQQFTHYFKRIAGRYVMLYIYCRQCTVHYIGLRPTPYPHASKPPFVCGDALHDRIAAVSRRTLELCMHEHYEDTPWREQALYAMDSRNQMLCGYYAFGETAMPRASLHLLAQGLREDGLLELCAPARVDENIPVFSLIFIQALNEYVAYSQDCSFGRDMMPVVHRILDTFLSKANDNGLISVFAGIGYWNFYEWNPQLNGFDTSWLETPIESFDAPLHAWLMLALQAAVALLERLGDSGSATKYQVAYNRLQEVIQDFWDEEKGCYRTFLAPRPVHYCQLTQALMVCAGAVPENRLERTLDALAYNPSLTPITLSHSIYKMDALMKRPEHYLPFVKDEIAEIWGNMLFSGATSFWETTQGASDFDHAGSLCHAWSAVPLYFYHRYVAGEDLVSG